MTTRVFLSTVFVLSLLWSLSLSRLVAQSAQGTPTPQGTPKGVGICHCCGPGCDCRPVCPPCPKQEDSDKIKHSLACAKDIRDDWQEHLSNLDRPPYYHTFLEHQKAVGSDAQRDPNCGGGGVGSGPDLAGGSPEGPTYIPASCESKLKSCTSVKFTVDCHPDTPSVINDICQKHEQGHIDDYESAFQNVKNGTWSGERWENYYRGSSAVEDDIKRQIGDEIKQYNMEIDMFQKWLDDAQKACAQMRNR